MEANNEDDEFFDDLEERIKDEYEVNSLIYKIERTIKDC